MTTRDKEGAEFYPITSITVSAWKPNEKGTARKFILWRDPKPAAIYPKD